MFGCGGGGGDDTGANAPPTATDFFAQGLYFGNATDITGETLDMIATIGADGRIDAADTYYGNVHYGVLSASNNNATGALRSFAAPGYYWEANNMGVIDTDISFSQSATDLSITGKVTYNGITLTNFVLSNLEDDYNNPPLSYNEIAGTYSAFLYNSDVYIAVSSSGSVTGYDTSGCDYNGSLGAGTDNKNLYDISLNVSNCGEFNGGWNGKTFFILRPDANPLLVLSAHNSNAGRAGIFYWISE